MPGITRTTVVVAAVALMGCASGGVREPDEQAGSSAPGASLEDVFAGKFPGVEVSHVPTGGITIRIRGMNTIMGSNEPLFIIDGARVQSGAGGLLFLDPNEIKKIEVLKDIGSTGIYGADGANGVIIITTKRGIK